MNNENDYDVVWASRGFPRPWCFRVEAYIDIDPTFHDTSFEDQLYEVTKLQGITYRVGNLIIGGQKALPAWVRDKVNEIIECDIFALDGVQWKKEPGNNWTTTPAPNSDLKSASILLRNTDTGWEYNNSDLTAFNFKVHDETYDDVYA